MSIHGSVARVSVGIVVPIVGVIRGERRSVVVAMVIPRSSAKEAERSCLNVSFYYSKKENVKKYSVNKFSIRNEVRSFW